MINGWQVSGISQWQSGAPLAVRSDQSPTFTFSGTAIGSPPLDGRNVHRRRQETDHGIQQWLHTLVLEGRSAENRRQLDGDGSLADRRFQLFIADRQAADELLKPRLVGFACSLDDFFAIVVNNILVLCRNLTDGIFGAERFIAI